MIWEGATRQGSGARNDDRWLAVGNIGIVIDGATSDAEGRNGGWYAQQLARAIRRRLPNREPLADLLGPGIDEVTHRFNLTPGESPSAAVALARINPDAIELCVLCDCSAVVVAPDGVPFVLTDQRLEQVGADIRATIRERLQAGSGFDDEHRRLLATLRDQERRVRNTDAGYWVAEADPQAAEHALTTSIPREVGTSVVLTSDGASAAVDLYRARTWHALTRRAVRADLAQITTLEERDPDGERWPRSKRSDDKTVARSASRENFPY